MTSSLGETWRSTFNDVLQRREDAAALKEASMHGPLRQWTQLLTGSVVETCENLGWSASAIGHKLQLLPVAKSEYLGLDVTAFADGEKRWRFPKAVFELENVLKDDRIAYSLWKVLCVRADLRVVFCYRKTSSEASALVQLLSDEVVGAMGVQGRIDLQGEILVVVGSREESAYFPYGFFKWWQLEPNTGKFRVM
ncbi:MAG: hypothetical protein ACP5HU_12820 [Phycisphaerae bacterium]